MNSQGVSIYSQPLNNNFIKSYKLATKVKENSKEITQQEKKIDSEKNDNEQIELSNLKKHVRTNVQFELHEDLEEYYVTIVDPVTKEVVREIPPKELLDMFASMMDHMGILVDEKI